MKAYTKTQYGGPEVLKLEEVEQPALKDNQLKISNQMIIGHRF